MTKTKITIAKKGKKKVTVGVLDVDSKEVIFKGDKKAKLKDLKNVTYHETRSDGKIIQKFGKFLGSNK